MSGISKVKKYLNVFNSPPEATPPKVKKEIASKTNTTTAAIKNIPTKQSEPTLNKTKKTSSYFSNILKKFTFSKQTEKDALVVLNDKKKDLVEKIKDLNPDQRIIIIDNHISPTISVNSSPSCGSSSSKNKWLNYIYLAAAYYVIFNYGTTIVSHISSELTDKFVPKPVLKAFNWIGSFFPSASDSIPNPNITPSLKKHFTPTSKSTHSANHNPQDLQTNKELPKSFSNETFSENGFSHIDDNPSSTPVGEVKISLGSLLTLVPGIITVIALKIIKQLPI